MKKENILWCVILLFMAGLIVTSGLCIYQHDAMQTLREENAALAQRSETLDELLALAEELPLGYANEVFRASKSVLVLDSGESEELKLTANWKGNGQVAVECRGKSAELSFTEENWEIYTTVKVEALQPGVTVARFRSSTTDKSFALWIFVR